MEKGSSPISRVLSSGPVEDRPAGQSFLWTTCCHAAQAAYPGTPRAASTSPYLALPRMGFTVPSLLPVPRWALTPPFHPCLISEEPSAVCSLLHFPSLSPEGYGARPLAGILLYGARTFLAARTQRDCLANFPARSIAA